MPAPTVPMDTMPGCELSRFSAVEEWLLSIAIVLGFLGGAYLWRLH
jgi:hypothetical protein